MQKFLLQCASQQACSAAIGAPGSDRPDVRRDSGVDTPLRTSRRRWRTGGAGVRGELERTAIRIRVVYFPVELGDDFHRNLCPGFQIVPLRRRSLPVLLIVFQIEVRTVLIPRRGRIGRASVREGVAATEISRCR